MKFIIDCKNNLTNWKWISLVVVITALLCSSCSIIGWMIGSVKQKKGEDNIAGWQTESIKVGDRIRIRLSNSDTVIGEFQGTELATLESYSILYREARQNLANIVELPDLGEELIISSENNYPNSESNVGRYYFEGFGYNTIYVRNSNNINQRLSLVHNSKLKLVNGSTLNKGLIFVKLRKQEIPVRTYLLVKDTKGTVNKINSMVLNGPITVFKKGNYGMEGLGIGLVADVVILVGILRAIDNLNNIGNSTESWSSCPLVYSYDGSKYILDSEPFGGSIYQKSQRTDVDKLEYLKADQGYYRFKLANELDETQYVDEFKLVVVDHPEQHSLLPSFDGNIHSFSRLTPPISAIDQNENEVLDRVNNKDNNYWVSYPFNRNPVVDGDERDALILEFDKPSGAEEVNLAFNVQNTIWASSLQKELISMQGSKINEWYAYMNNTPEARTVFTNAMIREGMLLIKEWTGTEWVTRDFIWEVGPAIPKDQAVKIKLQPNESQKLRIKLESTVGLWMINSVFADYGQQVTFPVTELSPVKAITQNGRNVLDIISKNDGTYYEMPNKTDWASIAFKSLPNPSKGLKRSYFLKCGGYYHIHVDNSIEPNHELIKELIAKPGAYGKFTLRNLNDKLSSVIE